MLQADGWQGTSEKLFRCTDTHMAAYRLMTKEDVVGCPRFTRENDGEKVSAS